MKLLDFNNMGYDIFRRWYIDGRLYYHMIIDEKNPKLGLREVRYIDPRKIRKVRESIKKKDPTNVAQIYTKPNEYYIFQIKDLQKTVGKV